MVKKVDQETEREFGHTLLRDILVFNQGRTEAQILAPLVDEDLRPYNAELSRRWREQMPTLPVGNHCNLRRCKWRRQLMRVRIPALWARC